MSLVSRIKNDEKENNIKVHKLQLKKGFTSNNGFNGHGGVGVTVETKRPALGLLGNKPPLNSTNHIIEKSSAISGINFKTVKPRVDTWNKLSRKSVRTESIAPSHAIPTAPITSTHTSAVTNRISVLTSKQTIKLVKTSTHQTAKLEAATKITIPSKGIKTKSNENLNVKNPPNQIRRQESILSRRSIVKITKALNKEKQEENNTTKQKSVSATVDENSTTSHSTKLIYSIANIDLNDAENPLLVSEYVKDIYAYLSHLEIVFPISENYMIDQHQVTAKMRGVLIDWINEVHYQFKLETETFYMTVSIIDRYLQVVKNTSRQCLQLVGVTALFIASKYEELYPPELKDFVYITDDTYTKRQILEMEKIILKRLQFNLSRPLPIHFLRRFSKAATTYATVHLMAKYFIELSAVEYSFVRYRPSEIAAAALYISLALLSNNNNNNNNNNENEISSIWTTTLEHYSTYSEVHLKPIVLLLAQLIQNAPNAKLKAVYTKYKLSKFEEISNRSELRGDNLKRIIEYMK